MTADLSQIGGETAQELVADDNNTGIWRWSGQVTPDTAGEQLITITTVDSQEQINNIHKRFRVFDTTRAIAIAASFYDIGIAVKADGTVRAWGCEQNSIYDLGKCKIPEGLSNVVDVAASNLCCMALKLDGTITVWGSNEYGQRDVPAGLTDVISIYAGPQHCLALKADGTVIAWGDNTSGQCNIPADLTDVIAVSGECAVKADGSVVSWENNGEPVSEGLRDAVAISADGLYNIYGIFSYTAVKADGTAVAWGKGARVPIRAGGGFTAVTMQYYGTTFGLRKDGTLVGWCPSGVPFGPYFPYYVLRGMENIVAVDGSLALDKDGRVFQVYLWVGFPNLGSSQPLPDEL